MRCRINSSAPETDVVPVNGCMTHHGRLAKTHALAPGRAQDLVRVRSCMPWWLWNGGGLDSENVVVDGIQAGPGKIWHRLLPTDSSSPMPNPALALYHILVQHSTIQVCPLACSISYPEWLATR